MSDLRHPDMSEEDLLAAEHALGLTDGAERHRCERRMRHDPAFAEAVADWNGRLSPLYAAFEPAEPPAGLWAGIDADVTRLARAATVPQPLDPRPRGRRVSAAWQWFGLGSFGLLVGSLAALLVVVEPRPRAEPMTASLAGESGPPLYTAVVYPGLRIATLVPVSVDPADPGHSRELWLIEPDKAPLSLGVLKSSGALRIEISPELLAKGGILAISREPIGGSPTGQPTGPVIAKGELQAI